LRIEASGFAASRTPIIERSSDVQCWTFQPCALLREARSADLVIIGQVKAPANAYVALDPGQAILKTGCPTLVVPADAVSPLQAEHVMIGWKDTREARRAVWDVLPLLHLTTRG
jgi:hypothetical protein